jgi:hypothetical protein
LLIQRLLKWLGGNGFVERGRLREELLRLPMWPIQALVYADP